jgi:DNA-binding MarR family transcriptional regulator
MASEVPHTTGLGTLLRHLVEQLDGDVETVYRQQGVNCRSRFTPVIRHLEAHGPSTIRSIALASGLTHSAISQTVAEMLKQGLVTSAAGEDGRERIIAFSAAGEALLPRLHEIWSALWAASDELSEAIGVSLPLVLGKSLAALEEVPFRDRVTRRLESKGKRPTRKKSAAKA